MKTLTFVRHAQSVANAGGVTMVHDAIPLSELGVLQARELSTLLKPKPAAVQVSCFIRTRLTADPFCERCSQQIEVNPYLHEFSLIDPALIEGLDGEQRKPFVKAYWDDPDPHRRHGAESDTFAEFAARVGEFLEQMDTLPDGTVIFGHGIWFALLLWRLLGYRVIDTADMRAFRRFQLGLPMPNCAVFTLVGVGDGRWSVQANTEIARRIAAVSQAYRDRVAVAQLNQVPMK